MPCELDPIDATEAEDAELYLLPDGKLIRFDMCDSQHMDIEELYVPHWHNCDSARRFRK